jgi:hypothetical protein
VITADDVETLVFDVLGTVVDEAGSMRAEALADVLRDGPQLPEATVRQLGLAGHRLRLWPDTQAVGSRSTSWPSTRAAPS